MCVNYTAMQTTPRPVTRIRRLPDVVEMLGVSATTIWRMRRRGDFPEPVRVSPGCVGWLESDLEAWVAARAEAGR